MNWQFRGLNLVLIKLKWNYLLALGVAALLGLLCLLHGEADAEEPEEISVGGLDVGVSLDQSLPLLDHRPQLVGRQVHAVEVGQAVLALNVLADQLELLERPLGVLKQQIQTKTTIKYHRVLKAKKSYSSE